MRYIFHLQLTVCLLILAGGLQVTIAQVVDDFSDGDFTNNPTWQGESSKFKVNTSEQLQLSAPSQNDTAYLQTPNTSIDSTEWRFYTKLDFNPSSNNFSRIYLVANQANLEGAVNGYYIRIGGVDDDISLYKTGSSLPLINGPTGMVDQSPVKVRVRVRRNNSGHWYLGVDTLGGTNFQPIGDSTDNTYTTTSNFGVYCEYTSTRSDKFFFDDFYVGNYQIDNQPPSIQAIRVTGSKQLDVTFNEGVDKSSAEQLSHYSVDQGVGSPTTATRDAGNQQLVHLSFANSFQDETVHTLTIDSVADFSDNYLQNGSQSFTFYLVKQNDVIISELLADPTPPVSLPESEYIELHNRSDHAISLAGWRYKDPSTTATLPDIELPADSFLILCRSSDVGFFQPYGTVIGLSSWPTLNNGGDLLVLTNGHGKTIFSLEYSDDWYRQSLKEQGGWSLEMKDVENPCAGASNWQGSNNEQGGTPGQPNSYNVSITDTTPPHLVHAFPQTPSVVELHFSEPVDSLSARKPSRYKVKPGIGQPVTAQVVSPQFESVHLQLPASLQSGKTYTIHASGVRDCAGNRIDTAQGVRVALPQPVDSFDIVINEILFNPLPEGADFVELYNRSEKVINLQTLNIANADEESGLIEETEAIKAEGFLIFPGDYYALTEGPELLERDYEIKKPGNLLQLKNLPTYTNQSGSATLATTSGQKIDQFAYDEEMHFSLLEDNEGVSLERINFHRPTQDTNNWHSAASTAGYATPGYENSQFSANPKGNNQVTLQPKVFSPDADGYKDFLNIHYDFESGGRVAQVIIYDAKGRQVQHLANNQLLGKEGTLKWDGTNEQGEKARLGIYVIYFEAFNDKGEVLKFKKSCVLGGDM